MIKGRYKDKLTVGLDKMGKNKFLENPEVGKVI
jgi:hypothetical protein